MGDEDDIEEYVAGLHMQLEEKDSQLEMAAEIGNELLGKNEQLADELDEQKELYKLQEEETTNLQEQLAEAVRLIEAFQEREEDLKGNERGDVQAIEELQHQIDELHGDAAIHKEENARLTAEMDKKEARFEEQEQNWLARIAELEEELENETQKVADLVENQQIARQQSTGRRRSITLDKSLTSPWGGLLEEEDSDEEKTTAIEVDEEVAQEVERLQRELEKWRNQHQASEQARNSEAEVRREAVQEKRKLEIRTRNAEESADIAEERSTTAAAESAKLYKQVEQYKRNIGAQQTKITRLESEMETMKRMQSLQSEGDGMMSLLDELTTEDNSAWEAEKDLLEKQIGDMNQKWRDAIKARDEMRQQVEVSEKRDAQSRQLQRDFDSLQTKSQADAESVMTLDRDNERLRGELTAASAAADELRSAQAVEKKETLDFRSQLDKVQGERQAELERLQAMQSELDEARSGRLGKESDLMDLRKKLREQELDAEQSGKDAKKLGMVQNQKEKLTGENEKLKVQTAELKVQLENQVREKEMLQTHQDERSQSGSADEAKLLQQVNELMSQVSELSSKAAREQEELRQTHETQMREMEEKVEARSGEGPAAEDTEKITSLERQLEQFQDENGGLLETFKEFQSILDQQKAELGQFMVDVTKAEEEKRLAQQERSEESGRLRSMELRSRKAEDNVHAVNQEIATTKLQFKRLRQQVVAAQELDDQVLTAVILMDNPYCSCILTRLHGLPELDD